MVLEAGLSFHDSLVEDRDDDESVRGILTWPPFTLTLYPVTNGGVWRIHPLSIVLPSTPLATCFPTTAWLVGVGDGHGVAVDTFVSIVWEEMQVDENVRTDGAPSSAVWTVMKSQS